LGLIFSITGVLKCPGIIGCKSQSGLLGLDFTIFFKISLPDTAFSLDEILVNRGKLPGRLFNNLTPEDFLCFQNHATLVRQTINFVFVGGTLRKHIRFSWFITVILLTSGCQVSQPSTELPSQNGQLTPTKVEIQSEAVIKIQPETSVVKVEDTVTIDILVEDVSNLMGVELELQFNPTVLQAQDADPDEEGIQVQPGQFLAPDFQVNNTIDNGTGLVQYIVTQVSPTEPARGNGVITSITFKAIAPGVSELTLTKTNLASPDGERIITTPMSGQVTVEK
jgi:hypothetical protein